MSVDNIIWERIVQSDTEAYSQMYREYFRRFYNYGSKFTDDHILLEDSIQETLLLIWEKRHSIPEIRYVSTYFYSTFRNNLFTKLRSGKSKLVNAVIEEPEFSVEDIIIAAEVDSQQKAQLRRAINQLTSRQREAIFLRFYENLPFEDVASVLNITTKATYKIVARAIDQLRELMVLHLFWMVFVPTLKV